MLSSARACGRAMRSCFRRSVGTWSSSNTARCWMRRSASPAAKRYANGSTIVPTSSTPRWCFRAAPPGAKRLLDEIGDQGPVTRLIEARSDAELHRLMTNLAGHDLPTLIEAFGKVDHDRPTCFIAYTIKGFGLPFAGHKDNHAGLMTPAQMESFRAAMKIRPGHEWDAFEGLRHRTRPSCRHFSTACRLPRATAATIPNASRCRRNCRSRSSRSCRRKRASARCSMKLGREQTEIAERIVTTSPDVTVSTNLGAWVNRRGLFAREIWPTPSRASTFPPRSIGTFRPRASISSSASRR